MITYGEWLDKVADRLNVSGPTIQRNEALDRWFRTGVSAEDAARRIALAVAEAMRSLK